jgi:hypothetical protein
LITWLSLVVEAAALRLEVVEVVVVLVVLEQAQD